MEKKMKGRRGIRMKERKTQEERELDTLIVGSVKEK